MILLIDTSQETGTIALSQAGEIRFFEENAVARAHASWLHLAIQRMLITAKITLRELDAVAVVAGPGSYTGLRVALAAAKGFCFALKIPLITLNSLRLMAGAMQSIATDKESWICPMLDARREEVFTAMYDQNLDEILKPQALILDKNAFETQLAQASILFAGTGSKKWQALTTSPHAHFVPQPDLKQAFAKMAHQAFEARAFADPVYTEPVYLKEFFSY